MTLVEFLAPLSTAPHRDRVLATLYFAREYESEPLMTVQRIRDRLVAARVRGARKVNIPDVLARAGHLVASTKQGGRYEWELTNSGIRYVRELLNLPEDGVQAIHEAASLESLAHEIPDEVVRGYVEEAVLCLKAGALRSSIVFLWTGAIRTLQESALNGHSGSQVTAAIQKHDTKARPVSKVEDFSNIKDAVALLAFRELGLIDKGQWQTLNEALGLRNRCGHPTKYRPGPQKASAFIEDVVGIVFL